MFKLKELRIENGLKRSEFAKAINLPASTVANYENETRQAPYETLILFANYFGVTVDTLLGRTNEINPDYLLEQNARVLTSDEKQLLATYRASSPLAKNRIMEYTKILFHSNLI